MKEPRKTSVTQDETCGRIEDSLYNRVEVSRFAEMGEGNEYMAHMNTLAQFGHGDTPEEALRALLRRVDEVHAEILDILEEGKEPAEEDEK